MTPIKSTVRFDWAQLQALVERMLELQDFASDLELSRQKRFAFARELVSESWLPELALWLISTPSPDAEELELLKLIGEVERRREEIRTMIKARAQQANP
jgi:hypothetical protein